MFHRPLLPEFNKKLSDLELLSMEVTVKRKKICPLQNKCLAPNLTYKAVVENNSNEDVTIYFSLAEKSFKEKFQNHTKDFNHR